MTGLEQRLHAQLAEITPLYEAPMREAQARQDALAKPPGSLGLLEEISVQLAGITGSVKNEIGHGRIYVLCGDNGVVCEGVSSAPQSVTRAQAINLTRGLTGASCLAKHFGDELVVVDMGIALPYTCPEILDHSLGKGTANIAAGPAMTREQAVQGILTGMALAAQAKRVLRRPCRAQRQRRGERHGPRRRRDRCGVLKEKAGHRAGAFREPPGQGRSGRRALQGRRLRSLRDDGRLPRRGA